ncbi:hypothetical protein ACWEGE_39050 [Amycolatopsis sp. NPDC004747]
MIRRRKKQAPAPEPAPGGHFHITPLVPPPAPPRAAAPDPAPKTVFGARFAHPADALTFVAAIRDDEHRRYPPVVRDPARSVWVIVHGYQGKDVELSWALGGVVHLPEGSDLVSPRGRRHRWQDVSAWPAVSWLELAAGIAPGKAVAEQAEVVVVTSGPLARWVIDRSQAADLDVRVATARLTPAFPEQAGDWPAVLLKVTAPGRAVPTAFTRALTGLPSTVVCRPSGGRLLIDQRLVLPLLDADLTRWVPDGWELLLAGDLGVRRITERSAEYAPPLRADTTLASPPAPPPGRLPADLRVEVALVPDRQARPVDALLLTDDELLPLRRFLTGHPAAERALLVLGPGRHLYAEPGRLVSDIPFGVPLCRLGPGALYQEAGHRLKPTLPAAARARLFAVDAESVVVMHASGTCRLSLRSAVPVWTLWLGPTVAAEPTPDSLSAAAKAVLEQADAAGARIEPDVPADARTVEQTGLYTEGFQLEQQGKLAEAARKYWEAGEPALAARLYERAAGAGQ